MQNKLGYAFIDQDLLKIALTHSSSSGSKNNQRLEFLGDAILNFIIADYLYKHNPDATEGELTRIRSNLVKESTLCLIAKKHNLPNYINLGVGELKTGGLYKSSILADTLEAIIAAVYLDSNLATIQNLIINWYQDLYYFQSNGRLNEGNNLLDPQDKDPKTLLQELLHAKALPLPVYKIMKITGKPHNQLFKVSCMVSGIEDLICGTGSNRKQAEQNAAKVALERLK